MHGQAEERLLLEIKYKLGLAFGHILKIVQLPAPQQREGVDLIPLGQREGTIRLRVGGKFTAVEILKKIDIAQQVDISSAIDVVCEKKPLLEGHTVAVLRLGLCWLSRRFDRSHILCLKNIIRS